MKKLLFLLIPVFLCGGYSRGQLTDYTFTVSSREYTEITGGTLLGNTTTDDQRFVDPANPLGGPTLIGPGFPIGFDFAFDCNVFDRFAINTNGWISLGKSSLTPSVNLSSSNSYFPVGSVFTIVPVELVSRIAIFGRDLMAQADAELRIETLGAAPERECVIQWKNYRKYNAGGIGDSYNFQLRMQESSNNIVFVYGPMINNATSTTVQVGLRGAPATIASNWKNLTSTTNWTTPTAGMANMASMLLSDTIFPPEGTTYTWVPPNCLPPFNLMATIIQTTSVNLDWTAGGNESFWNLKYGSPGFNPETEGTMVAGLSDNQYSLTGLEECTAYEFYIQSDCPEYCNNFAISSWSGPCPFYTDGSGEMEVSAGTDNSVYTNAPYTLTDAAVSGHISLFWATSGDGFFDNENMLHPVYMPGPDDCLNMSVELCLTAFPANPCHDAVTDCMLLTFIDSCNLQSLSISTGIDRADNNSMLFYDEQDRFWKLTAVPGGPLVTPRNTYVAYPHPDWGSIIGNNWIGPIPNSGSFEPGLPSGNFTYEFTFCLKDTSQVAINITMFADEWGRVFLNGTEPENLILTRPHPGWYGTPTSGSYAGDLFVPGENTIYVIVRNFASSWGGNTPSGFSLAGNITCAGNSIGYPGCCGFDCNLAVDSISQINEICPGMCDGAIAITLDSESLFAPFTITQIFPDTQESWTTNTTPPYTIAIPDRCQGWHIFEISDLTGECVIMDSVCVGMDYQNCCPQACEDFDEGSHNFVMYNSHLLNVTNTTNQIYIEMPGYGGAPGNLGMKVTDMVGATWVYDTINFQGNFFNCPENCLCWDMNVVQNCESYLPSVWIFSGFDPNLPWDDYHTPFQNLAQFTSYSQTGLNVWTHTCAPIKPSPDSSAPPLSTEGQWTWIYGGLDWDEFISNIDGILFRVDVTGCTSQEEVTRYDNVCLQECQCMINVESVNVVNTSCFPVCEGEITLTIDSESLFAPFNITQIFPDTQESWTTNTTPPYTIAIPDRCQGWHIFEISDLTGDCTLLDSVYVGLNEITWTGSPDPGGNCWFVSTNWNPPVIPDEGTSVSIPGGCDSYPTITENTYCICGLTIHEGGSLIGQQYLCMSNDAVVERSIPGPGFHMISSPVNDATFGDIFLPAYWNDIWVREYDEPGGNWENRFIADNLGIGRGYSVQMNTVPLTATFTGTLIGYNVPVALSNLNTSGNIDRAGWNLVGNPFPSAIDWDVFSAGDYDAQVAVWDQEGAGNYIYWNGTVGSLTNGIIPAQNSFFVKTMVNGANLTIPLAAQVHSPQPLYKDVVANALELRVTGNNFYDATFVHFNSNATADFDSKSDAFKLEGLELAPQLYSLAAGYKLSINELPYEGNEAVNLGFKCGAEGTYSLNASGMESFSLSTPILLEDLKINTIQDLRINPVYSFNYLTADNEKRFTLHFRSVTGISDAANSGICIYSYERTVVINNSTGLAAEVSIFDMTGRKIKEASLGSTPVTRIPLQSAIGNYIVKVATVQKVVNQKVIIQ